MKAPPAAWSGTGTAICAAVTSASGASPRTSGSRRFERWLSRNEVAGFDVTREPNGFRVSAVAADLADRKTEMR